MRVLTFKIDEQHLAYQQWLKFFTEPKKAPKDWQELYDQIQQKHGRDIAFTMFTPDTAGWAFNPIGLNESGAVRLKNPARVMQIFDDIKASPQFERLLAETIEFKKTVEQEWSQYGPKALGMLKDITQLPIGDRQFTVYLLHPDIENGSYIDNNQIEWGLRSKWLNYHTVGLCHEVLHAYTAGHSSDLTHAIVFLAADEELRCRLNLAPDYFDQNGAKTYYPSVIEEEKRILPEWREYLQANARSKETIVDLYNRLKTKI